MSARSSSRWRASSVLSVIAASVLGFAILPQPVGGQEKQAGEPDPTAIEVAEGYRVEVFAEGLSYPSDIAFGDNGEVYVAETGGHTYGTKPDKAPPPKIVQIMPDGSTRVVYDTVVPMEEVKKAPLEATDLPEGLISPITGITWHDGRLYVSHRTRVSTLDPNTGEFSTIIGGIPSWGEFQNNKPVFGPDGKMYFVVSTQGNSGPVDGHMMEVMKAFDKPDAHEAPCADVTLTGQNYELDNKLTEEKGDKITAGVYVPLGETTSEGQVIEGQKWCHGAMYRANPDGSGVEVMAWGLRSNYGYAFSADGRLLVTQNSGNIMEPRPVYNDWEPVYEIEEGAWYGWPDYYSSIPVTDPRFSEPRFVVGEVPDKAQRFEHKFALTEETRRQLLKDRAAPPAPVAYLPVHSAAEGMVFGREDFGIPENEIIVAEFGAIIPYYKAPDAWPGFRVQRLDLQTGEARDLLVNEDRKPAWEIGSGGLRRPLQVAWGPDGALYVVDLGVIRFDEEGMQAEPETGVVWKVTRAQSEQ